MTRLDEYLASDEEMVLSFSATDIKEGDDDDSTPFDSLVPTSGYEFGATDRRIVYLSDEDEFKDIDYRHISSIESDSERDDEQAAGPLVTGCCGGFFVLGAIGAISDSPGTGLFLLLLGGVLILAAVKWMQKVDTSEKQKVKFITGDEAHQQITVTLEQDTDTNVGAELSRILREQRS